MLLLDGGEGRADILQGRLAFTQGLFRRGFLLRSTVGEVRADEEASVAALAVVRATAAVCGAEFLAAVARASSVAAVDWRVPESERACTSESVFWACLTSSAAAAAVASGVVADFNAATAAVRAGSFEFLSVSAFSDAAFVPLAARRRRPSRPLPTRAWPSQRALWPAAN